jgi:hypothetical protein
MSINNDMSITADQDFTGDYIGSYRYAAVSINHGSLRYCNRLQLLIWQGFYLCRSGLCEA